MHRKLSILASAGAALACVLAATAVPAAASSRALAAIGNSNGFAGYSATMPVKADSTFSLNVNVPVLNCTKKPQRVMYLTADLQGTVTGGGSNASGMQVLMACSVKTPEYVVYMLDDGTQQDPGMIVSGDDKLTFTGSATASSESYTATDVTTSQTLTGVGTGLTPSGINLWLQAADSGTQVFPPLKKPITFSSIKVDHKAFSALNPDGFNDVDAASNLEVSTSALSTPGTSFTLTYVSNT